jgi:hypothetical protein
MTPVRNVDNATHVDVVDADIVIDTPHFMSLVHDVRRSEGSAFVQYSCG